MELQDENLKAKREMLTITEVNSAVKLNGESIKSTKKLAENILMNLSGKIDPDYKCVVNDELIQGGLLEVSYELVQNNSKEIIELRSILEEISLQIK